jgi:hypothetical protein
MGVLRQLWIWGVSLFSDFVLDGQLFYHSKGFASELQNEITERLFLFCVAYGQMSSLKWGPGRGFASLRIRRVSLLQDFVSDDQRVTIS